MDKKYLILVIILAILAVVFLYPKTNNVWEDYFVADNLGHSQFKNMDCTCIGFTALKSASMMDIQGKWCFGMPVDCKYDCKKIVNDEWQTVSCEQLD